MEILELSGEEKALLLQAADDHASIMGWIFHISVLTPPIAFAAYGLYKEDYMALFVAFCALFLLVCWRLVAESSSNRIFATIAKKVLFHVENTTP